jgi:hypothetical protein
MSMTQQGTKGARVVAVRGHWFARPRGEGSDVGPFSTAQEAEAWLDGDGAPEDVAALDMSILSRLRLSGDLMAHQGLPEHRVPLTRRAIDRLCEILGTFPMRMVAATTPDPAGEPLAVWVDSVWKKFGLDRVTRTVNMIHDASYWQGYRAAMEDARDFAALRAAQGWDRE